VDASAMAVLASFYDNVDVFLLILVRVLGFFMLLPVVSAMNIPAQVRVLLAVCFSVALYSSGMVMVGGYANNTAGYFGLILTEFFTGVFMGYILFFIFNVVFYAGQLIDYTIGFAMVSVLNPMTQTQVPIVGNFYYLAVSAMLVISGGLHSFIEAFFFSYRLLPIGAGQIVGNPSLAWYLLTLLTGFILMGVKIALPILAVMMVINVALGIMVKAVPQMNIFVVGMPIKVFVGLILLFMVLAPALGYIYTYLFDSAINELINVIWGLTP
jgi:flagellar biosynthetic protein FliR